MEQTWGLEGVLTRATIDSWIDIRLLLGHYQEVERLKSLRAAYDAKRTQPRS